MLYLLCCDDCGLEEENTQAHPFRNFFLASYSVLDSLWKFYIIWILPSGIWNEGPVLNSVPPPPNSRPLGTSESGVAWNKVFADIIKMQFKMRLYWIRVGPKCNHWFLYRKRRGHTDIYTLRHTGGEGLVKVKAEIGVMHLRVKKCQGLLAMTRS